MIFFEFFFKLRFKKYEIANHVAGYFQELQILRPSATALFYELSKIRSTQGALYASMIDMHHTNHYRIATKPLLNHFKT